MSLQSKILKDYRDLFPRDTLREISHRTGLQLTRVFRLLNGSPMKLAEYEVFHDLLETHQQPSESTATLRLLRTQGHRLSHTEMLKVHEYIQRKLQFNELVTSQHLSTVKKQELA